MQRIVKSGLGRPEFDPEMGGAETALCKLATKLVNPTGAEVKPYQRIASILI